VIPRTVDDLTAAWCGEALGREVRALTATPIGVGAGLVGQLYRLALRTADGPTTVVAKLAAPEPDDRFVATVLNMYGREVGFYRELSARVDVGHPTCLYADHDPTTQDTVLLLEDVAGRGRLHDQVAGCTLDDARPAIRALARFHAGTWGDESLGGIEWLLRLADDPYPGAVAFAYDTAWPRVQELLDDLVTPALRAFGDAYAARIPALFARLCEPPLVLAHADWRLDNLFFTPDDDVVAVDWQLVDRSVGPRDLAYLVTQSVEVDGPGRYDEALDLYLAELAAHGVDVERTWAHEAYRYGALLGFVYPVIAAGALTVADPRHLELTRAMLVRSLRALDALDAFDLPL
jgi:hypothetical protein